MRTFPRIPTAACGLALLVAGCAASAPARHTPAADATAPATAAVLPFEDLSGLAGTGERLTQMVYTEMTGSGRWSVEEPGETDVALAEARVRSTGVMTRDQAVLLAERLGVRWLLAGVVIEYGRVRSPDGDVPTVGLALRLLDGRTGRVVWADQRFRSGEDRETIFAWGRVRDLAQLASRTAAELVQAIRIPAGADTSSVGRGS